MPINAFVSKSPHLPFFDGPDDTAMPRKAFRPNPLFLISVYKNISKTWKPNMRKTFRSAPVTSDRARVVEDGGLHQHSTESCHTLQLFAYFNPVYPLFRDGKNI